MNLEVTTFMLNKYLSQFFNTCKYYNSKDYFHIMNGY